MILFVLFSSITVEAFDTPNDGGGSITVKAYNVPETVKKALVYRKAQGDTEYIFVGPMSILSYRYVDSDAALVNGEPYYYRVDFYLPDTVVSVASRTPGIAIAQWYDKSKTSSLIFLIVFSSLVLVFIQLAKKDPEGLFIRKIPALDAIDEAVGRSTELGKPTFFVHGLMGITDAGTLAALTILRRVSKKVAEYDTPILVTNFDPIVMTASQETVKQAYTEAGRPDAYNEKNIIYLTYEQFGYTAGVDGLMVRERPGAIFLQGYFFAESLILAETGHSVGAIQIAGTTAKEQLPFFVAACDYVLIGEEMLAASSYIGREPVMLGSVKGSDWGKVFLMCIIGIGVVFGTVASILQTVGNGALMNAFQRILSFL